MANQPKRSTPVRMRPAVGPRLSVKPAGGGKLVGVRRALGTGAVPPPAVEPMFSTDLSGPTTAPLNT